MTTAEKIEGVPTGASSRLVSRSPEETKGLGCCLGERLRAGDVILLQGTLGTGKTCFVQGIAQGLGVADYVTSPSFTLANEYPVSSTAAGLKLYHLDLYRIRDADEAMAAGIEDYLWRGDICVVEWAERAPELWPSEYLLITFEMGEGDTRYIRPLAAGARHIQLMKALDPHVDGY